MKDIELTDHVLKTPNLFNDKVIVTDDHIQVELKGIMISYGMGGGEYKTSRKTINKIISEIDNDFDIKTESGRYIFYFLREGVTRETLKAKHEKQIKKQIEKSNENREI